MKESRKEFIGSHEIVSGKHSEILPYARTIQMDGKHPNYMRAKQKEREGEGKGGEGKGKKEKGKEKRREKNE